MRGWDQEGGVNREGEERVDIACNEIQTYVFKLLHFDCVQKDAMKVQC